MEKFRSDEAGTIKKAPETGALKCFLILTAALTGAPKGYFFFFAGAFFFGAAFLVAFFIDLVLPNIKFCD
jgi:hypothetical protein